MARPPRPRPLHDERRAGALKRADIFEFYRRLAEANPDPETELESVNIYTLLVAVVPVRAGD